MNDGRCGTRSMSFAFGGLDTVTSLNVIDSSTMVLMALVRDRRVEDVVTARLLFGW